MNKATIRSIGVCGAGTMGSGIAQVCAQAGFQTLLFDLNAEIINQVRRNITQQWQRMVDKGKMTGDQQDAAINNLRFTSDISSCIADLFIEAIVEKPAAKIGLFNQLDAINQPDCIFASNTSSLSISQLAAQIKNPARVLGMHFFQPRARNETG
ncbi:MAG: 3-hydroxyacyl-CoA dehydrogenase NAD-binding domain-containing protein [Chitinophagaceae bacterium]|nr:3-hydroxyacyl-CoA dehydrogenase NAD-binding domain-containing protein [Chitinophagaceae bacterium]